ncbi:unnamed protein product [Rotaria sordida]|uniref:Mutator-like transposase domain-containing protein n=1 Tax=Rotaria sordida TaxID=392033 RepID=A0A814RW25_9BILA|nr:unnamed protein product [Rotaria sordida]CAF3735422.1 unnamed protein product [Rotaria sordida]
MITAVEEAVVEADGVRDLVVSGDGAWLTRGYSSLHGIATLCSTTAKPKVIDTNWCSKTCTKCQGAESLRRVNFDLFKTFQENHECQLNFTGTSGAMEKEMIREMFCRSLSKYKIKYISYIGDGDAKVHSFLTSNSPYLGVIIRESKFDLDKLYQKSWAIFKHHYSTDKEPTHDWCDPQWRKYLQAKLNGQQFSHNLKSTIPRACLNMIKPVFHELCSKASLARVVDDGSQNANETLHSILWTMVPKHRFCSSIILRIALDLSTIIYNDGYNSLGTLFTNIFSSIGYYSAECFDRLSSMRKRFNLKITNRRKKRTIATVTSTTSAANDSFSESDDEMLFMLNDKDSIDITQDLIGLDLTDDDTNTDYEPGGDY